MSSISNQDKKRYLHQYLKIKKRIERKSEEIAEWENIAMKCTSSLSQQISGGSREDKIQTAVEMIDSLRDEIKEQIQNLILEKQKLDNAINSVEDNTLQLLLEYRYIDGLKFENIAEKMSYSWRWILNLHGKALDELKITSW